MITNNVPLRKATTGVFSWEPVRTSKSKKGVFLLITNEYNDLNRQLHQGAGWGKGGEQWYTEIKEFLEATQAQTVLDYGCGKGALVAALNEYISCGYDPAVDSFKEPPFTKFDVVVSTDVLEHIEPDCLEEVLFHIESHTRKGAFLVISLRPACKILPDGRNAHLIQESQEWWEERLNAHFPRGISISYIHGGGAGTLVWKWRRHG